MKRIVVSTAALLFVLMLGIGTGHALDTVAVNASVPFAFYAGTKQMPAGVYNIAVDVESKTIEIRSANRRDAALLVATYVGDRSGDAQLVFDHIGNQYFLKTVDSQDAVLAFPAKQVEAQMAHAGSPVSTAAIALNR